MDSLSFIEKERRNSRIFPRIVTVLPFCFFSFLSKLLESSPPFLSPREEGPRCENWGLTVYQQRREWQTQKTNERGTKGVGRVESLDLETRLTLLFFLFFPLFLLPSPLSFSHQFVYFVSFLVRELTSQNEGSPEETPFFYFCFDSNLTPFPLPFYRPALWNQCFREFIDVGR